MAKIAKTIKSDPTAFAELESRVKSFDAGGRPRSIALLLWYKSLPYEATSEELLEKARDRLPAIRPEAAL